jgi:hypothetical protein
MKIISKEFGGYDDVAFLKVLWNMPLKDVENLLSDLPVELQWFKTFKSTGARMKMFTNRDIAVIKSRIPWIKQIIASKKKYPTFIPEQYK